MAFSTVRLALDCAKLTNHGLLSQFADEFGKVMQAYPVAEQEAATQKLIDLFRRHGKTVFGIVSDAVRKHSEDIAGQRLPPSSLLALLINSNLSSAPSPNPAAPTHLPDPPPDATPSGIAERQTKILVAVDDKKRMFRIWGGAILVGEVIFPIMKRLSDLRLEDRELLLAPKNFRGLVAKQLANELQLSDDDAVRSAIKRARDEFAAMFQNLEGTIPSAHTLIQHIRGKGYRLNPDVEIISMEELDTL